MVEDLVYLRGESGVVRPHRLPLPEGIADRLARGAIRRVNANGTDWAPLAAASGAAKPPSDQDLKQAWIDWAINCGASPDEAKAMTKQALIDTYA